MVFDTRWGKLKSYEYLPGDIVEHSGALGEFGVVTNVVGEDVWIKDEGDGRVGYADAAFLRKVERRWDVYDCLSRRWVAESPGFVTESEAQDWIKWWCQVNSYETVWKETEFEVRKIPEVS